MPAADVTIRDATKRDLRRIAALNAGLFLEDAGTRDPFIDLSWPDKHGIRYFTEFLNDERNRLLVADKDRHVVGYLAARLTGPSPLLSVFTANLESLYVDRGHRSGGIGDALVAEFFVWARQQKAGRAIVDAYAANERAIRFYQRAGFTPKHVVLDVTL